MASFNKLFIWVLGAMAYATTSSMAVPYPADAKHTTHRLRHVSRELKLSTYHPPSSFKAFGSGVDHPLSKRADATMGEISTSFLAEQYGWDESRVSYRTGVNAEMTGVAYLTQAHDGIPFANAVANVAVKDNKITSYGASFVDCSNVASSTPSITAEDAIAVAEDALGGTYNEWATTLEYFVREDQTAALTHVVQVQNDDTGAWYEAFVDAHSGELLSVTDFVSKASYNVVPFEQETIADGGLKLVVDPENLTSSPLGWHSDGTTNTTFTAGNNAIAVTGRSATLQSTASQVFDFDVNLKIDPDQSQDNIDAATTNAFVAVNTVHDVTYLYGFTEDAFNFQINNLGNGGRGGDPVMISVQDASGVNNADFSSGADGQPGRMRMFMFDLTTPLRDGALENDIVIHENMHGVTTRMTGGGTGRCLQTLEAGGMGEGWSDVMADWVAKTSAAVDDFTVGAFVSDDPAGLRSFPYSTDATVNPLTYGDLRQLNEVHDIGEVWANTLHNVYAALVSDLGFSATAKTDPTGPEGNVVFMHLMIDALQLQPCNPDFIAARDAWYQADAIRFNGANTCTLQAAFASRGLGLKARNHRDDDTVDPACAK